MKLLVTGGAGFIGSNFVRTFNRCYPEVPILIYDALTYAGNLNNLINLKYTFVRGNIEDYELFRNTVNQFKPDIIVNFAAESHVDRSIVNPQQFLVTNVLGVENVLRVSKECSVPKLVMISTDEVYGSIDSGESVETDRLEPNSPYSVSKAAGDLLCRAYMETFDYPVILLRGSNCYGPYQHPEKMIPKAITSLLNNKNIPIYGDGHQIREWIYVDDFVNGIIHTALQGTLGSVYNIGGGEKNRIKNIDLVFKILEITENSVSKISFVEDRKGHDTRYALNSSKINKDLNVHPIVAVYDGLVKTIRWYSENRDWWEPLTNESNSRST